MNYFFSGLFNTVNNRFSQEQEIRADLFGLRALNSYYGHVGGALSFFEKMAGQKDFPFFTGMGTHPSFSKRVVILKKEIKKAGYAVKDTGPLEFHKKEKKGDNQF
jgi:predicted Zn-dependent protease